MPDLNITLLQTELVWEDPEQNRKLLGEKIQAISNTTDLIVLPEMFTTGFTMQAHAFAEDMDGPSVKWLLDMARLKNAAIAGSLIIRENDAHFNRLVWAQPDGTIYTYDKRHLFRMAKENTVYSAGESKIIINWRGWNILPLVCYDLRFPVFSRWQPAESFDLILYVANWPEKRAAAWKALLPARAIENLSYCIGLNRTGMDGNGVSYAGESAICGPEGDVFFLPAHRELIQTNEISRKALDDFRQRFPAYLDADKFELL